MAWFFDIVNRYIPTLEGQNHIELVVNKNLRLVKTEVLRSAEFMDELKIVDAQQSELLFDLLRKHFNLFVKVANEKENYLILPELKNSKSDSVCQKNLLIF